MCYLYISHDTMYRYLTLKNKLAIHGCYAVATQPAVKPVNNKFNLLTNTPPPSHAIQL